MLWDTDDPRRSAADRGNAADFQNPSTYLSGLEGAGKGGGLLIGEDHFPGLAAKHFEPGDFIGIWHANLDFIGYHDYAPCTTPGG
jgi:hypothetical protein